MCGLPTYHFDEGIRSINYSTVGRIIKRFEKLAGNKWTNFSSARCKNYVQPRYLLYRSSLINNLFASLIIFSSVHEMSPSRDDQLNKSYRTVRPRYGISFAFGVQNEEKLSLYRAVLKVTEASGVLLFNLAKVSNYEMKFLFREEIRLWKKNIRRTVYQKCFHFGDTTMLSFILCR